MPFSVEVAQALAQCGTPAIPGAMTWPPATSQASPVTGILPASGGRTSHTAVVARQTGKVCLVGCADLRIDEGADQAARGHTVIATATRFASMQTPERSTRTRRR